MSEIENNSSKYVDVNYAQIVKTETNWNLTDDETKSLTTGQEILMKIVETRNEKQRLLKEQQLQRKRSPTRRLGVWLHKNLGLVIAGAAIVMVIAVLSIFLPCHITLVFCFHRAKAPVAEVELEDKEEHGKSSKKKGKKNK